MGASTKSEPAFVSITWLKLSSGPNVNVAILGSGQIGTDLLIKLSKLAEFNVVLVAGRRANSAGLKVATEMGIPTSTFGIDFELGYLRRSKFFSISFCAVKNSRDQEG